ncbi:MAG: VacB/RNase II family 3'-5' exoribonuclease [Planctomycetota bacterium]|nr:VacB/RNase II family 3'-5' exoribonuclease [Planctomycetota bacterium]MCX8040270.1 VacB/RNase II family 3'-5' exoribonuclease [Planctomycetota bacterium]MDW8372435.1 VacB/RNase II family 3'-5' exoribonuclease [Planctomycetota bacterium]
MGRWNARGHRFAGRGRRHARPLRTPLCAAVDAEALLAQLAAEPAGATAGELAAKLACDARAVALTLRRLVERGRVLELRPGRYRASGSGGEHSAIVVADGDRLLARCDDGASLPIDERHRLGCRAGDVVQVLRVGEQALVTRVLRRAGREVAGTVEFAAEGRYLIPDNRREGRLPVLSAFRGFEATYRAGDRVIGILEVDAEGRTGVHLTRILEPETPEVADFQHVCRIHDLPGEFPAEVRRAVQALPADFPLGAREDARALLVFTIDPATAKDFDDALSLTPRPEGGWRLGVHIADVAHFVAEHEAIDLEARRRGTSIYLINRVIPMLPERLANGLCSLVPNEDRYCLTAWLDLDDECRLVGTRLAETLIRSRHRLTYEEAQDILDGRDRPGRWPEDLRQTLRQVSALAQRLRAARVRDGALNLYSEEQRFALDVEGEPIEVEREGAAESHQLIEECMLLANRAVAAWLEERGSPCLYRVHAEPDPDRLRLLATALENHGLDGRRALAGRFGLQAVLADLERQPPAARLVLNFLCLRAFAKAVYQVDNIGHYALAFARYCHFTSPIRRYPDLVVHRLVKRALGLPGYHDCEARREVLHAVALQCSWLEQRAEDAERDLFARKAARYFARRLGEAVAGVVTAASPRGLTVQLLESGVDGFLPLRELNDDRYVFDEERLALVGKRSGRLYAPGRELTVRIDAVDIERSSIVLGRSPEAAPSAPLRRRR